MEVGLGMADAALPVCFFDVSIDGKYAGRIRMQLRPDVVPRTAEK